MDRPFDDTFPFPSPFFPFEELSWSLGVSLISNWSFVGRKPDFVSEENQTDWMNSVPIVEISSRWADSCFLKAWRNEEE